MAVFFCFLWYTQRDICITRQRKEPRKWLPWYLLRLHWKCHLWYFSFHITIQGNVHLKNKIALYNTRAIVCIYNTPRQWGHTVLDLCACYSCINFYVILVINNHYFGNHIAYIHLIFMLFHVYFFHHSSLCYFIRFPHLMAIDSLLQGCHSQYNYESVMVSFTMMIFPYRYVNAFLALWRRSGGFGNKPMDYLIAYSMHTVMICKQVCASVQIYLVRSIFTYLCYLISAVVLFVFILFSDNAILRWKSSSSSSSTSSSSSSSSSP